MMNSNGVSLKTMQKVGDHGTSSGTRIICGPSRHTGVVERWASEGPRVVHRVPTGSRLLKFHNFFMIIPRQMAQFP